MIAQNDEIRTRIIDIARNIFTHFGFKKTTMEEIAQASRKGKSSIYYYFSSKEEIFKAVVEKEAEELKSELAKRTENIEDPIEKLNVYIKVRMRKLDKLKNFYAALKSDYLSHLEFIEEIRNKYDKEEIKIVADIIQQGINAGKFNVDDAELSAIAIVTAMKGLEVPLFLNKEHRNIETRLTSLINFLFYGIVKR
ncbi:MAG TPA: TetR/AcrR family transcriptional regulator [Bacteroidales bacterium]|nr:TetR/AcrR family transcriptional regulator [Bacteroidales bacterium]